MSNLVGIYRMGEGGLLVSFGGGISVAVNERVHALCRQLEASALDGLVNLVPAYASLLIRFDPALIPEERLREGIAIALSNPESRSARHTRSHIVPVSYGGEDGPDLDVLSQETGLSTSEIVRLHSGREYRVYFLGFMPGFAYMGSVHRAISAPRLAAPRVRVPAGSVGIAGGQTGVYPFSSPGGWRLIGRSALALWDATREEPALFRAGDRVRFVESRLGRESDISQQLTVEPAIPAFRVVGGGTLTTIQDLGRPGYGSVGLPQGGALDPLAVRRANALVGNAQDAAVLEMLWTGPTLLALRTVTIGLDGADFDCRVDGERVPVGLSWLVRAGSTLRFEQRVPKPGSAVAYVAVSGGFDAPVLLGSRSAYLPGGFGGLGGRGLREGDTLGLAYGEAHPTALAGRFLKGDSRVAPSHETVLRFTRYDGPASIGGGACKRLVESTWVVGAQSDRIGVRLEPLEGAPLTMNVKEAVSFGVVRGAIQVPPNGRPIILGPDHQTTGGYPLAGVVAEEDWPLLAQVCPGSVVRFEEGVRGEGRGKRAR